YRFAGSGTVLHASYDHFFVPPAVENVLIASAGLTRFLQDFPVPLPPLQSIRENQFELGASQHISGGIRVALTGYYRKSDNRAHIPASSKRIVGENGFRVRKRYSHRG